MASRNPASKLAWANSVFSWSGASNSGPNSPQKSLVGQGLCPTPEEDIQPLTARHTGCSLCSGVGTFGPAAPSIIYNATGIHAINDESVFEGQVEETIFRWNESDFHRCFRLDPLPLNLL